MGDHTRGSTLTSGVGRRDVLKGIGAASLLSLTGLSGQAAASVENEAGDAATVRSRTGTPPSATTPRPSTAETTPRTRPSKSPTPAVAAAATR